MNDIEKEVSTEKILKALEKERAIFVPQITCHYCNQSRDFQEEFLKGYDYAISIAKRELNRRRGNL